MSFTLGNLPERVRGFHGDALDNYFRVARGRSAAATDDHGACCGGVAAGEMTKWFDTNSIETSRSDMELLDAFDHFKYPNAIGPGVYDIHSPNIPTHDRIVELMRAAAERIPSERLWVNPDCGLKTRQWAR